VFKVVSIFALSLVAACAVDTKGDDGQMLDDNPVSVRVEFRLGEGISGAVDGVPVASPYVFEEVFGSFEQAVAWQGIQITVSSSVEVVDIDTRGIHCTDLSDLTEESAVWGASIFRGRINIGVRGNCKSPLVNAGWVSN
jgi:hypothetical protein